MTGTTVAFIPYTMRSVYFVITARLLLIASMLTGTGAWGKVVGKKATQKKASDTSRLPEVSPSEEVRAKTFLARFHNELDFVFDLKDAATRDSVEKIVTAVAMHQNARIVDHIWYQNRLTKADLSKWAETQVQKDSLEAGLAHLLSLGVVLEERDGFIAGQGFEEVMVTLNVLRSMTRTMSSDSSAP